MERKINWQKLIFSFIIAVALFSFGIFLGFIAKGYVEKTSIKLQDSIRTQILTIETLNLLEDEFPCNSKTLDVTSEKLDYLGELVTLLENKKGKNDKETLELKKLYTDLEIRHMIFVKNRNKDCGQNYTIFLYFYSNSEECNDKNEDISAILTYLRRKHDYVRLYSFDNDLDSDIVKILKEKFNTSGCNSIIYNDKNINFIPKNSRDLEEYMAETRR